MARIAIGVCGEGRGHATRILTLIERLPPGHEIRVFTSADAFEMVSRRFPADGPVRVTEIPGLTFHYTAGRLDELRTIAAGVDFWFREFGPLISRLEEELRSFDADLVLTDFEPAVARAAGRPGIPVASIDHQHFLVAYDLGMLPRTLQWRAAFNGLAVRCYRIRARATVISAFFRPPLRPGWRHAIQVGPLLRTSLVAATPTAGDYLVSYLRRHTPRATLDSLADCGLPVRVYGLGTRESFGGLSFHDIDERRFVEDLAGCRALVSAAGNQLIGETLHLGKPMLVLPEKNHVEQSINSHFLAAMGAGTFHHLEDLSPEHVRDFVAGLDRFAAGAAAYRGTMDGTPAVLDVIDSLLA